MSIEGSDSDKSDRKPVARSNLIGLGWQIASTLLVFTAGGYALDRWLDTNPWLLLTGAVFGMISVFYQILRVAAELDQAEKRKKKSGVRSPVSGARPKSDVSPGSED